MSEGSMGHRTGPTYARQVIGSLVAAVVIAAATIAGVTARLGPGLVDDELEKQREELQEQREELLEERQELREDG